MMPYTLTYLDTTRIQNYIFRSNRLQENIGASELVHRATTLWVFWALEQNGFQNNVIGGRTNNWSLDSSKILEIDSPLDAEVIYAGGGNALILFRNMEQALNFSKRLTLRILIDAPGLIALVQHISVDWNKDNLFQKRNELLRNMAGHKLSRTPSMPLLGIGANAVCKTTGLPAVRDTSGSLIIEGKKVPLKLSNEDDRFVSREAMAKLGWRDFAQERLKNNVGELLLGEYRFPSDLDMLGRIEGEESYIAIVHADGNNMGEHFNGIGQDVNNQIGWHIPAQANREYVNRLRKFSSSITKASMRALKDVVNQIIQAITWDLELKQLLVSGIIPIFNNFLPFRPIVFGGDDITFITNGQLGVSLAAAYLGAFENEMRNEGLNNIYASAGIAIVKMHYPFARAYKLSEELTNSAKTLIRFENRSDCSALDWHFAASGLSGHISSIRSKEYNVESGRLLLRPVRLRIGDDDQSGRYWEGGVQKIIQEFQGNVWAERRNKVIGLREKLRNGPANVETYRLNFELPELPALIPGDFDHQKTGWFGSQCIYFDAIELMDHYVPLSMKERSQ